MELSVRDWMIIVGVLLIIVVLFDGYRRIRNERRNTIRMSLNRQFLNAGGEGEQFSSELPNGGARVVRRDPDAVNIGDERVEQPAARSHNVPLLMDIESDEPPREETWATDDALAAGAGQTPVDDTVEPEQAVAASAESELQTAKENGLAAATEYVPAEAPETDAVAEVAEAADSPAGQLSYLDRKRDHDREEAGFGSAPVRRPDAGPPGSDCH